MTEEFTCRCGTPVDAALVRACESYGCVCGVIWRAQGDGFVSLAPEDNPEARLVEVLGQSAWLIEVKT